MVVLDGVAEGLSLSRTFRGAHSPVLSVAYLPSQKQCVSGSQDGCVMVWNFRPQHRAYRLRGHKGAVTAVDVAPDERFFASGSADHTVRLWKPSVRGSNLCFRAHNGGVCSVKFSVDSQLLVTSSTDKLVKLWDVSRAELSKSKRPRFLWCVHGHNNWVRSADISLNSLLVCSGGDDKAVKVWDAETAAEVCAFDDHTASVRTVQFDPLMAVCVASAGDDATINLWDIRTQHVAQHYSLPQTSSAVTSIKFHPSGNYLLSGSEDSNVRVWDLREGRPMLSISAHTQKVNCIDFSPDGRHFLSGSSDHTVLAWRCDTLCEPEAGEEGATGGDGAAEEFVGVVEGAAIAGEEKELEDEGRRHKSSRRRSHSKKSRRHSKKLDAEQAVDEEITGHRRRKSRSGSHHKRKPSRHSKKRSEETTTTTSRRRRGSSKSKKAAKQAFEMEEMEAAAVHPSNESLSGGVDENDAQTWSNLGEFTRAAIQASVRRKSDDRSDASSIRQSLSAQQVDTLARAMQNLEARLRMNEDAVADLRQSHGPSD